MSKKRGFTLAELLVVIAVTTLVLTMVGGSFIFMTESSGKLIDKSEELAQTQNIEKYVRNFVKQEIGNNALNPNSFAITKSFIKDEESGLNAKLYLDDNGNIIHEYFITVENKDENGEIINTYEEKRTEIVFSDTNLSLFTIDIPNDSPSIDLNGKTYKFYSCQIKYINGDYYEFFLGICEIDS